MSKYIFGADIGGTTVKLGFFSEDGTLLDKWQIPTRVEMAGSEIIPDIARAVLGRLASENLSPSDVLGIGVGVPGPVRNGVCPVAVNLHWGEVDVAGKLGELTGIPVTVANDAHMAALGEMWQGGAMGYQNVLLVTLGTGVGGGIVIEGKVLEGAHGAGGEIGHMPIDDEIKEPCNCGNYGCFEQFASATGLVRLAKEELAAKAPGEESLLDNEKVSSRTIFDAYGRGDAVAERIINRFASYLGKGLGILTATIDPDVVVLGGGVANAGEALVSVVSRYYRKRAFSTCKTTPIVPAKLGNDAGIYGGAKLVIG